MTEGEAVAGYGEVASVLVTLRARGLRVTVDDAGSGDAGLARILKLAPDFIKLDRELVTGIDVDPVRRTMATTLVTFAGDSGAENAAEGIETAREAEAIRHLGIRFGHGHHLPPAAPVFGALAQLAV